MDNSYKKGNLIIYFIIIYYIIIIKGFFFFKMNALKKFVLQFVFKDFYSLKNLEDPTFSEELIKIREKVKNYSEPREGIKKQMEIEMCKVNGYIYYRIQNKNNKNSNKKVLYIHGGAFFLEALKVHWNFCHKLSKETGCEIVFPCYPLVPESNSEKTHEMLLTVYKELLKNSKPEDITVMGDSAGGTLSLSLSMLARDQGLPLAHEIILISPGFNIGKTTEEESKRLEEIKKNDYILGDFPVEKIKVIWCGNLNPNDYRVNVMNGSLKGLPRITLFSGTNDVMNIPARRFVSKMEKEGHPYCYEEKEGGLHVYVLIKNSPSELELIKSRVMDN